jgi:MoxR-like ATPase
MNDPRERLLAVRDEVGKAVKGQEQVVGGVLAALLLHGHVILEGVPGVAKTLMVKALGRALDLEFRRIQFTPDLMPSDVTGNLVYEAATGEFRFRPGPVFANLVLADELNRTPPKTQAAMLEAMEERQVSIEGRSEPLPDPFIVIKITVGYPERAAEREVLRMHDRGVDPHDLDAIGVQRVAGPDDLAAGAQAIAGVGFADDLLEYVLSLAHETRTSPALALGVSPRGAAMLLRASKVSAWLSGRDFVTPDDVKGVLKPAWRHRLVLRPEVELEGASPDTILDSVADRVPVPG